MSRFFRVEPRDGDVAGLAGRLRSAGHIVKGVDDVSVSAVTFESVSDLAWADAVQSHFGCKLVEVSCDEEE